MILTAVFFRPVRKLSLNTERKSDGDAKAAVNFCLSDFADFCEVNEYLYDAIAELEKMKILQRIGKVNFN